MRAEKYNAKTPLFVKMDYKFRKEETEKLKKKEQEHENFIKEKFKPLNDQEMKVCFINLFKSHLKNSMKKEERKRKRKG